jgi:hypothetical protein
MSGRLQLRRAEIRLRVLREKIVLVARCNLLLVSLVRQTRRDRVLARNLDLDGAIARLRVSSTLARALIQLLKLLLVEIKRGLVLSWLFLV